ncbi:phage protease [Gemmobacter serpentinus]|uniref:phage protease n=1 Tax=Gemmobacter serpentinus TaxID=2652247 RepID=UPI0018657A88|nr:phage protease [Gemmobacter serpentinus]
MKPRAPFLSAIALNAAEGVAPDWVQLTPPGPQILGRDGRWWTLTDPQAVAARFDPTKEPQIDIEHASQLQAPQGLPAPAVGWIKEIAVRDAALWGRVEWTPVGTALVTERAYRYLSPAFSFDPATGEILEIVCAGLTNTPNLELAALNAAQPETFDMDKAVLEALGLAATATATEALVAINALKSEKAVALNAAQHPDPAQFVPRADHQLALNRITQFETEAKDRGEAEAVAAVDAAITAGKIAPVSRDYHLATCRADGGLQRFRDFAAAQPVIAPPSGLDGKPLPKADAKTLSSEELAVCRQMGMSADDFIAARAAEKQE